MAYIHILIKDYSKLCLENFTTGLGSIWLSLHDEGGKRGGTSGTTKDECHVIKGELPSSPIFFLISVPPQSNAKLSGRVSPRLIWELGQGWESVTQLLGTFESSFVAGADDHHDK